MIKGFIKWIGNFVWQIFDNDEKQENHSFFQNKFDEEFKKSFIEKYWHLKDEKNISKNIQYRKIYEVIKANRNFQWVKVKDALSEIYNKDFSFAWTWYESFKKRVKKEFPNTPTSKSDGSYKKVFTYCSNNKLNVFEVLKEIYWKEEIEKKFIFLKENIEGKKLKEILKKETDLQEIKKGFLKDLVFLLIITIFCI